MTRQRLTLTIAGVALLGAALAFPYLRYNAWGLLRGEPFAAGHSLSYWTWALQAGNAQEREQAAHALGSIDAPAAVAALRAALHDDSYIVRRIAAEALGKLGKSARPAAGGLIEAAQDPDARVRVQAARALGQIDPPVAAALPVLLKLAQHDVDVTTRAAALTALGALGDQAAPAIPVLIACLGQPATPEADTGEAARHSLERLGSAAVPALLAACASEQPRTRSGAARTLGAMGEIARPGLPALEKLRGDAEPIVRVHAAAALWKLTGKAEDLDLLIEVLRGEDVPARAEALVLLGDLGERGAPAVEAMRACLQAQDETTRRLAAETLPRIGRPALAALADLEELAKNDPKPDVRRAAELGAQALRTLQP
ncbi:MAG: HEAT repeat domain-containing protein [Gemmataceae bacterium]